MKNFRLVDFAVVAMFCSSLAGFTYGIGPKLSTLQLLSLEQIDSLNKILGYGSGSGSGIASASL